MSFAKWFTQKKNFQALLVCQNILLLIWSILIPADDKNAFLLGFSIQRWLIFGAHIGMIIAVSIGFKPAIRKIITSSNLFKKIFTNTISFRSVVFFAGILYFTIALPEERLLDFAAYFVRLRPYLVSFSLTAFEIFLYLYWKHIQIQHPGFLRKNIVNNRLVIVSIIVISLTGLIIFLLLAFLNLSPSNQSGIVNSNSIITPFQFILTVWIIYLLLGNSEEEHQIKIHTKWNKVAIFIFIWSLSAVLLLNTPLTCQNDMKGPYQPNGVCYPDVTDSPLSIGSYYITLGNGIYNQWYTDKPFYMVFLAVGQILFGLELKNAILFQVIVLSMLPAAAFLFGSKYSKPISGLLFSTFMLLLEVNNIRFYGFAEIVNVKIPATEILTALLLLFATWILSDSLMKKGSLPFLAISGGIFGLASLTRLNPIFVLPFVLLILVLKFPKEKKLRTHASWFFIIGFLAVVIPAQMSLVNANGIPISFIKIRNVLINRYQVDLEIFNTQNEESSEHLRPIPIASLANAELDGFYPVEHITRQNTVDETTSIKKPSIFNPVKNFILLWIENTFRSLTLFPINTSLDFPEDIYHQPLLDPTNRSLMWFASATITNKIMLMVSMVFVTFGIVVMTIKKGIEGLLPLAIFVGYNTGNALALTSGGRFLQPVFWVVLFYMSIGVLEGYQLFLPEYKVESVKTLNKIITSQESIKNSRNFVKYLFILFMIVAMATIIPATRLIQPRNQRFNEATIHSYVIEHFPSSNEISNAELLRFLENPDTIVVEGYAYHPKIYRSPLFGGNNEVFELTVLTDEKVYISTLFGHKNIMKFQEGSRIIMVGCSFEEKNYWGAKTNIVRTLAVFQLDNQRQIYVNTRYNMECE